MKYLLVVLVFGAMTAHGKALSKWRVKNKISYTYLTWENEDTATTMTVNYHATVDEDNKATVLFSESPQGGVPALYEFKAFGQTKKIKSIKRLFHRVTLEGLQAGQVYYFVVGDESIGYSKEMSFKTLPSDSSKIKFITGGDMGATPKTNEMLKHVETPTSKGYLLPCKLATNYAALIIENVS